MLGHRSHRAQALLEFALALPIFLLVVYGLMEASRWIFTIAAVSTASREAARYASASGINAAGNLNYQDCAAIRDAARSVGFLLNLSDTDIRIYFDDESPPRTPPLPIPPASPWVEYCTPHGVPVDTSMRPNTGDRVAVIVSSSYEPILPLVPFSGAPISATSSRTITGTIDLNQH